MLSDLTFRVKFKTQKEGKLQVQEINGSFFVQEVGYLLLCLRYR